MTSDNNDYGWQVNETPDSFQILPNSAFATILRFDAVGSQPVQLTMKQ
jgi:hypothetical protein